MISTRPVLFGFAVVSIGFLSGSLQHAAAQSAEEAVRASKTELHEPAPEEPALQLQLDDAGVEVVPSPRRTPDGYTLEDMERRVKRAKIGLGVSAGVYGLGLGLTFASAACDDEPAPGEIDIFPACSTALITTGSVLVIGGAVGMILSGVRLARSKRDIGHGRHSR